MSEKLCLQWNDFKENVKTAFGSLRDDQDFSDVTLACEDGQQVEAHKVILAASSPFFQDLLRKLKHPHPMIYLRGIHSQDLIAIVDFLYCGEAKVLQENLDSFLAIAEELKLNGLSGQNSKDLVNTRKKLVKSIPQNEEKPNHPPRGQMPTSEESIGKGLLSKEKIEKENRALSLPGQLSTDLLALDKKVKSMMMYSKKNISKPSPNGPPIQIKIMICKVCQKRGTPPIIMNHIEAKHLKGIVIPCNLCDKVISSRNNLSSHKSRQHKNLK